MRRLFFLFAVVVLAIGCAQSGTTNSEDEVANEPLSITLEDVVRVDGANLVEPDGDILFIRGTNLGNWINPEGYMFGFQKVNSAHFIDEMLRQAVGVDYTNEFWRAFKDNYVTEADIAFIASTGANTIRLPFHYKLFTDEDYMGLTCEQDGFERIDAVVEWCREYGLYVILDMHDAPGGQTGDNIDDSYGYPWLMVSKESQALYCDIWKRIAAHYKNEPVVLGYDLLNEPIAPYFGEDVAMLNSKLREVYRMGFEAVRSEDPYHIVILGGAQWNGNFEPLEDCNFDEQVMYSCHRYGGGTSADAIRSFIDFRDKVNRPMYMGEIGHNTYEWMSEFCKTMTDNNIGYTFWPYKKIGKSSWVGFDGSDDWQKMVQFAESNRDSYQHIREAREAAGGSETLHRAMTALSEAVKFENCHIDKEYIRALGLRAE